MLVPTWGLITRISIFHHILVSLALIPLFYVFVIRHVVARRRIWEIALAILALFWPLLFWGFLFFVEDMGVGQGIIPKFMFAFLAAIFIAFIIKVLRQPNRAAIGLGFFGTVFFVIGILLGMALHFGNQRWPIYFRYAHDVFIFAGLGILALHILVGSRQKHVAADWKHWASKRFRSALFGAALLMIAAPIHAYKLSPLNLTVHLISDSLPSKQELGEVIFDGAGTPSSLFSANSYSCGGVAGCHSDEYLQWQSSTHRFTANILVRKEITQMNMERDKDWLRWTRYCAGCHAPASLWSNELSKDFENQRDETVKEGNSCMVCHRITAVRSTGNGSYTLHAPKEDFYPLSHEFPTRSYFLINAKPDQHNVYFMRKAPVMSSSEYCAACHEGRHPISGAQFYDAYQTWEQWCKLTGESTTCQDCHMPYFVDHVGNKKRSHRILGVNQAFSIMLGEFPATEVHRQIVRRSYVRSFKYFPAQGYEAAEEESEKYLQGQFEIQEIDFFRARPLISISIGSAENPKPRRDWTVEVASHLDVKVGHGFPTGPIDPWLALVVTDGNGREIFSSGIPNETGHVPPGTHKLGKTYLNANGEIVKGDVWNAEKVVDFQKIDPMGTRFDRYVIPIPFNSIPPYKVTAIWKVRKSKQPLVDLAFGSGVTFPITDVASESKQFP